MKTPIFLFMGSADSNDSVIYRDSYDQQDQDLIFSLFGKTLMARWPITEEIYHEKLPAATLKLYPGVGHTVTKEMMDDVVAFFAQHLRRVMKYLYSTHRVVYRRTNSASLRDHLITTVIIDLEGG